MAKKAKTKEQRLAEREERVIRIKERYAPTPIKDVIYDIISKIPVTSEIPDDIVAQIMEIEEAVGQKVTRQQVMVHAIINRAMQGNVDAFRELLDRTEGKVANKNENKNLNVTYEDWLKEQANGNGNGENA